VVDYNAEELNQLWKWMSEQRLWDAPALIYGVAFLCSWIFQIFMKDHWSKPTIGNDDK
jgi:hypothetical protein